MSGIPVSYAGLWVFPSPHGPDGGPIPFVPLVTLWYLMGTGSNPPLATLGDLIRTCLSHWSFWNTVLEKGGRELSWGTSPQWRELSW